MRWSSPAAAARAAGLVLSFLWPAAATAQWAEPLGVARVGPSRIQPEPGNATTALFQVTNRSARRRGIRAELLLPKDWREITGAGSLVLERNASDTRIVSFTIPDRAAPGIYTVRFVIRDEAEPHASARDSVFVVVRRRRRLELKLVDAPRFAVAGGSYEAGFLLRNAGNAAARISIDIRSSGGLAATTDSTIVTLPPGGTRSVPVTVSTRGSRSRSELHILELRAIEADGSDSTGASVSSQVEVIPRGSGTPPRGPRYPIYVTARASDVPGAASPIQASGSGTLTENGSTRLDFLFRGQAAHPALLAEQDEYRLSLSGERFDLRLGDQFFSLSPLAEPGRPGFGAGARLRIGPVTGGGFVSRNRRSPLREEERAAFLETRIAGPVKVGVNYVALGDSGGRSWTARGTIEPGRYFGLDVEYGRGMGAADGGEAYSIRLRNLGRRLSYDLWRVRADSLFPGYYRAAVQDVASLALRPWRELNLSASATRQGLRAPGTDGTRVDRSYEGSVGYGALISLGYRHSEHALTAATANFATVETTLRARLGAPLGRLWLYPTAELGETRNRLTATRAPVRKLGLQATLNLGGGTSYSVAADYASGRSLRSGTPYRSVLGSASVFQQLGRDTRVRVSLSGRQPLDPDDEIQGMLDVAVERELFFGHRIVLRGRWRSYPGVSEAERRVLFADYTIPLGIPVARRQPVSRIAGRVYDRQTGRGWADVVVRIGSQTVITDRHGRWAVASAKPGRHFIELDPTSLPSGQVAVGEWPRAVVVEPGRSLRVEIAVARASRLVGTVLIAGSPRPQSGDPGAAQRAATGPLRDVVLELSDGTRTLVRVSDEFGKFEFSDLTPGRWTLTPAAASLPAHHAFEPKQLQLDLVPGAEIETTITALPVQRRVRIVDQGDIRVAPARPAPKRPRPSGR